MHDKRLHEEIHHTASGCNLTLERRLFQLIDANENLESLRTSYSSMKANMKLYLPAILAVFPHYSAHDASHTANIITAVERILGPKRICQLTAADIWLLLMSAYMHDIGMLVTYAERKKIWGEAEFQDYLKQMAESHDPDFARAAKLIVDRDFDEISPWPIVMGQAVTLLIAEYYRGQHATRSGKVSAGHSPISRLLTLTLDGDDNRVFGTIGCIARLHGCDFTKIFDTLPEHDNLLGIPMCPRFAAVMLRLGDLCDVDNGRFNLAVMEVFGELPESSLAHYYKHKTIRHISISEKLISMGADVPFDEIESALRTRESAVPDPESFCHKVVYEHQRWFDMLDQELQSVRLNSQRIFPPDVDQTVPGYHFEILVDGKKSLYSSQNLRFHFAQDKAFELIEGYSLYDEPRTFLRELVQNSLDAMKIQMWRDIREGRWDSVLAKLPPDKGDAYSKLEPFDLTPEIYGHYHVDIDVSPHASLPGVSAITISDNGIGISLDTLQTHIIEAGSSWSTRKEYQQELNRMPKWLRPTGSFGIGLHSVFAVTDRLTIETKTQYEKHPHKIILHSGKRDGFMFVREVDGGVKQGTKMILEVADERCLEQANIKPRNPTSPRRQTAWRPGCGSMCKPT